MHSHDDLINLLIEEAMDRENGSHMDKYLPKQLRKETPPEKSSRGTLRQPHCNRWKDRGGPLKHRKQNPLLQRQRGP